MQKLTKNQKELLKKIAVAEQVTIAGEFAYINFDERVYSELDRRGLISSYRELTSEGWEWLNVNEDYDAYDARIIAQDIVDKKQGVRRIQAWWDDISGTYEGYVFDAFNDRVIIRFCDKATGISLTANNRGRYYVYLGENEIQDIENFDILRITVEGFLKIAHMLATTMKALMYG